MFQWRHLASLVPDPGKKSNDRTWRLWDFVVWDHHLFRCISGWETMWDFPASHVSFLGVWVFTGNIFTYPKYMQNRYQNYLWPIKTIRKTLFSNCFAVWAVHEKMHETNTATSSRFFFCEGERVFPFFFETGLFQLLKISTWSLLLQPSKTGAGWLACRHKNRTSGGTPCDLGKFEQQ